MKMTGIRYGTSLFALLWSMTLQAHDLHHEVSEGQALVAHFFFMDNTPFSHENYEIYHQGDALPYQSGRTDAHGYVSFVPDRAGQWRVKVFSADGHGVSVDITTTADMTLASVEKPFVDRYGRIVIGVSVLLGFFGILSLALRRKKNAL